MDDCGMNSRLVVAEIYCILYYKYLKMINHSVKASLRCTDVCLFLAV